MILYRLSREKYKDELSGYGAALNGQRWNSKGTEVIYTAESRALATSEVAVHVPIGILPKDYHMVEVEVPDSLVINVLSTKDLPKGWDAVPGGPASQFIGDDFVSAYEHALSKVPSVVVRGDFNYIINPRHVDFKQIKIVRTVPFPFDERLFRPKD